VPSVLHVAPDGDVLGRFVPTGYESIVDALVVDDVFPEVVGQRFRFRSRSACTRTWRNSSSKQGSW
jgi:hypothetical protein